MIGQLAGYVANGHRFMVGWPGYRLSALLRVLTALVSMATAFVLIRDLPKLIEVKPEDELKIYKMEKQMKK